ncbi:3'-5' exonuclease [Novosphingopyxis sp.]|uniref:3'-5' exonuclease n=1 Tax=Novosphingopyxis sp. TaxID=2709690 RepID=UPI003B5AA563
MHTHHFNPASETLAEQLIRDSNYRILRAVPPRFTKMPEDGVPPEGRCIAIVDTETSGLDPDNDCVIELAIMLLFVSPVGEVIAHLGPLAWMEDPQRTLDPRITLLTGLGAQHLTGQKIDDAFALKMLERADLLVAHNARFDAAFIERRYPSIAGRAWACSCAEIDWLLLGHDGRAQQHLLSQAGWFAGAHRAPDDVWSLFWLLQQRQRGPGGGAMRTHLARLIEAADKPTVMVQAERAPFDKKDLLKARSYQWNSKARFWQKELPENDVDIEEAWAFRNGLPPLTKREITACERHR